MWKWKSHLESIGGDIYLGDEEILIEYDGIAFHKGKEKIKKDVQRDIQILQKENNNVRKIIRIRETGEAHTREEVEGVEMVNYDSTRDIKERGYRELIKVTEYLIKGIKGECTTLRYEDMDIYTNTIWSSKATNLFDKFPHLIGYFGIKNKEDTNLITYGSEMWFEWECQKCGNSWEEQPIKISKRKEINVCRRCKKERELNIVEEDKKRRLELIKKRKKRKEDRECVVCGRKAYGGGKEEWVTYCSRECQTESERKIKVQGEGKLYQELVETPVFDIVAKRYGVTINTLKRECKRNGIPNNSKYYTDKYKEEKGYTYYTWLEYLKYKEERKEDYEYVVKNLGVKTKNQLTKKEKVVTLNVYSVIEREKSVEGA